MATRTWRKILVANRGEIAIRVLRAAYELGLRTVAIYTYEDRYSLHRYKADEAYQIGKREDALKPYLDFEEIIALAKREQVDAIHPGYGFLSENVDFVRRCSQEGLAFVGPTAEAMEQLGNKVRAKELAQKLQIPLIAGNKKPLTDLLTAKSEAGDIGYPVLLKAASGGGGRGMRVVRSEGELERSFQEAKNEAERAFGDGTVFLEQFVENPKHIEVQILGDQHGSIVHLFERDCSVQRRFQKVVEVAPAPGLKPETKEKLYAYSLKMAREVQYQNAGTFEYLVDESENIFFIEVNPRIQVEHTVTEQVTGVDIVRSQLLIGQGYRLDESALNIGTQESLTCSGFAVQCRITTEDPENDFTPDYGRLLAYRSPGGFGIRLDAGSAFTGAVISPFFDSLLVKVTGSGRDLPSAARRLWRALQEFRVRGVKTNIAFLLNVLSHPVFQSGATRVNFIADHPELLRYKKGRDRATRLLQFLGEIAVNGNPDVKGTTPRLRYTVAPVPAFNPGTQPPPGSRDRLKFMGREAFVNDLLKNPKVQYTDTSFRDAHQSLLATRVRTYDLLQIAEAYAQAHPELFSIEMWGGATFDVAMRFLHECPWRRLKLLREAIPNILFQMLFRGSNGVGYSAYPDSVIEAFIVKAAENGIDVFRIFDSMNWLEAMKTSIKTVLDQTDALAEVCICYTGDIGDRSRTKYTLKYYLDLAKQIEDLGAHLIAIKDMAGLLKPAAAEELVGELKAALSIPIHLHTHDTSSIQAASYLKAVDAGVDVIDVALASVSGLTSQPNFNSIATMLNQHPRGQAIDVSSLNQFSQYFEVVREFYAPFETELRAGTAEVYEHEIPGGQYSNLRPQARALGLEDEFETVKKNYIAVNQLLGDLVKVTPSSKVVGDVALFMTSNKLTAEDLITRGDELSFPESLKSFFRGDLGQPFGGFPEALQAKVLKGEEAYTCRPNQRIDAIDMEQGFEDFRSSFGDHRSFEEYLSFILYPKVYQDFVQAEKRYGDLSVLPTPAFLYALEPGQELLIDIDRGKTLIIELRYIEAPDEQGMRRVHFRLNGQARAIDVVDQSITPKTRAHRKVERDSHIGAPLQGKLSDLMVSVGDAVEKGAVLFVIEAMKMETTVTAPRAGIVEDIFLQPGDLVATDDLIVNLIDS